MKHIKLFESEISDVKQGESFKYKRCNSYTTNGECDKFETWTVKILHIVDYYGEDTVDFEGKNEKGERVVGFVSKKSFLKRIIEKM